MKTPETIKLREQVDAYIRDLRIDEKSEATCRGYANKLDIFCRWLENSKFAEQGPTSEAMMAFKSHLNSKGRTVNTISQYLIVLRTFFAWAVEVPEAYEKNPVSKRLIPKVKQQDKPYEEYLSKEDVQKIFALNRTGHYCHTKHPRNYAMMVLFITTGLRSCELRTLTLSSVDFEQNRILVFNGKGSKFRVVAMPELAKRAVKEYLNSRYRPLDLAETDFLFGSVREGEWMQLDHSTVYRAVESYVENITGKKVSPHQLRHVYSRTLLQAGAPMEEIQSMLGHSNPQTTQIYTGRLLLPTAESTAHKVFEQLTSELAAF